MKRFIPLLLFIGAIASISCKDNEVYVSFEKKSGLNAKSESFVIINVSQAVYESPTFEDNSLVNLEACLPKSSNHTYTLHLLHSKQSRWDDSSYLIIRGIYDNIIFKNNMLRSVKETHTISLYYAIQMYPIVRFAHLSVPDEWINPEFYDENWDQEALGSIPYSREGTQYFRKSFIALPHMASYELRLFYQYGIVVYMNGIELFRDHLPEGKITPQTTSTGQYDQIAYHSIYRSARDFTSDTVVLCIEEHYPDLSQHRITMDFWLAILAPSVFNRPCAVLPLQPQLTSSPWVESIDSILNMDLRTKVPSLPIPLTLNIQFNSSYFPQINGVQFYSSNFPTEAPLNYTLFTLNNTRLLIQSFQLEPYDYTYSTSISPVVEMIYSSYSLLISSTASSQLSLSQVQFLTCNYDKPKTIEFQHSSYSASQYAPIRIQPKYGGFYDCSVLPNLHPGLVLNSDLCIIEGMIEDIMHSTTYRVSSKRYSGMFSLGVEKGFCKDGKERVMIDETKEKGCSGKKGSIVWGRHAVECKVVDHSLQLITVENTCHEIQMSWIVGLVVIVTVIVVGIVLYKRFIAKPLANAEFNVKLILIVFLNK